MEAHFAEVVLFSPPKVISQNSAACTLLSPIFRAALRLSPDLGLQGPSVF